MTFYTRVRRSALHVLLGFAVTGVVLLFLGRLVIAERSSPVVESYSLYPAEPTELSVDYRHYANLRRPGEVLRREPSIQSDIVTDPYVRLFIPYYPHAHEKLLAEVCPDVRPLPDAGLLPSDVEHEPEDLRVALECLSQIHEVRLNGEPLEGAEYRFFEDPETGVRGIVTYIATDPLPRGRNELRVIRRFSAEGAREARERLAEEEGVAVEEVGPQAVAEQRPRYVIPFWR